MLLTEFLTERIIGLSKVDCSGIGVFPVGLHPLHVSIREIKLRRVLVNWDVQRDCFHAGSGAKRRSHCGVYSAGDSYD